MIEVTEIVVHEADQPDLVIQGWSACNAISTQSIICSTDSIPTENLIVDGSYSY